LEKNRAEAKAMSIYEYNQEEHIRLEREDAFEEGRKVGKEEGREDGSRVNCTL
jgi:flagellar biosynthesis/type III secretory pathway protein FliH